MLAFGPDDATEQRLRGRPGLEYLSADIDGTQAMVAADVTRLPFDDGSFDSVLCSHVLEHVGDEQGALRELRRVLAPGGWAAIMVPVDRSVPETIEDPAVTTPQERLARYGHDDHVRLYGADVATRLGADAVVDPLTRFGAERERRHGLRRADRFGPDEVYLCRALRDRARHAALPVMSAGSGPAIAGWTAASAGRTGSTARSASGAPTFTTTSSPAAPATTASTRTGASRRTPCSRPSSPGSTATACASSTSAPAR